MNQYLSFIKSKANFNNPPVDFDTWGQYDYDVLKHEKYCYNTDMWVGKTVGDWDYEFKDNVETVAIQEPSGGAVAAVTLSHLSGGNRYGCKFETISGTNKGITISNRFNSSFTEVLRIDTESQVLPGSDNAQNLGSSTKRWKNIYSADLHCSNKGSKNDVDGTWGDYTIQEGESDLFLINNRSGKKYKFNLTEVN